MLADRMQQVDRTPEDIDAVLVTHEHSDHAQGVGAFVRRYKVPVHMTPGTAVATKFTGCYESVRHGVDIQVGDIIVTPFPVPHDAREPVQFTFSAAGSKLGILTDTGHASSHVTASLRECDALAIEFNHDLDTLQSGPYPATLKARVASNFGHLNNQQASQLVDELSHTGLRWVVALHMSEQNNSTAKIQSAMSKQCPTVGFDFQYAVQGKPSGWFDVNPMNPAP